MLDPGHGPARAPTDSARGRPGCFPCGARTLCPGLLNNCTKFSNCDRTARRAASPGARGGARRLYVRRSHGREQVWRRAPGGLIVAITGHLHVSGTSPCRPSCARLRSGAFPPAGEGGRVCRWDRSLKQDARAHKPRHHIHRRGAVVVRAQAGNSAKLAAAAAVATSVLAGVRDLWESVRSGVPGPLRGVPPRPDLTRPHLPRPRCCRPLPFPTRLPLRAGSECPDLRRAAGPDLPAGGRAPRRDRRRAASAAAPRQSTAGGPAAEAAERGPGLHGEARPQSPQRAPETPRPPASLPPRSRAAASQTPAR